MSRNPVPDGAMQGSVAPAGGAHATAERAGTPQPPALPATHTTVVPIGFSNLSHRSGAAGVHLAEDRSPSPGRLGVVMAALMIGLLLMGTQLWLLTVALELFLAGHGPEVWLLALVSGAIFAGGVMMLRVLDRRPRVGP